MKTKRLLTHISLFVFILIISVSGFAKEELFESKWAAQPVTIDGLGDDWDGDVFTTEKKVKVDYAIRNDAQNMYVLFIFRDPQYLSTVNATGITLYYNIEGKKNKDHAFNFVQRKVGPDELIAYLESRGEVLSEEQKQSIKTKPAYNVFMTDRVGKKDEEISGKVQAADAQKPVFKLSRKGNEFIYEIRVPLIKSETSPRGMGVEPGQTVKIGFEWGGMTKELAERLKNQGGAISQEGRAGGMIDSRSSTGGAPSGTSRRMPKKYDFWFDVKLAENQ
jgi:hypothetical protein